MYPCVLFIARVIDYISLFADRIPFSIMYSNDLVGDMIRIVLPRKDDDKLND